MPYQTARHPHPSTPGLTDAAPVAACACLVREGQTPQLTFATTRWLTLLGLTQEAVSSSFHHATEAVHPDDRPSFLRCQTNAWAAGHAFQWEGRLLVNHHTRWVSLESTPRPDPNGGTVWESVMTDITARKEKEEQLIAGERDYRKALGNLPIAVAITTLEPEPAVVFLNAAFERTLGYTLHEIPTVAAWAILAYPDATYRTAVFKVWNAAVTRAIQSHGHVESMEFKVHCRDTTQRDIVFSAVVLDDSLLITLVDITERNRAENELQSLRQELEHTAYELTENIPVGTYTMVQPPDGGLASFNFLSTRFLEMTGLDREQARQDPLKAFACIHPDDYDEWLRLNIEVFTKKSPFHGEARVVVNNEIRWIRAESIPRSLPDGSTVWEGVLIDITAQTLAEQQLAASETRLRKILDHLPVAIAISTLDPTPSLSFLNEQFIQTFGYTPEDIATTADWTARAYPDKNYRQAASQIWQEKVSLAQKSHGVVEPMEFRIRCKNGSQRIVVINALIYEDMLLIAHLDITERQQAEAALIAARNREKSLEQEQRIKLESKLRSSLAASAVAHEINQPLSTILLQSNMPLRDSSEAGKVLRSIAAEAQRVVSTIEKMKVLLRNVQTTAKPVNLAQVVKSSVLQVKRTLEQNRIHVRHQNSLKACRIEGDDAQLQLALTNLLRNSAEAIAEANCETREISLDIVTRQKSIILIIDDSGPGWSGVEKDETPLNTTKPSGSGIGLYVVRTAMKNHHGTISFGQSPLGGAQVRLRFPKPVEKPSTYTPATAPATHARNHRPKSTVIQSQAATPPL
jgi:PAS domain S-box-containing protein